MLLSPSVDSYAQVEIEHPHCQPPFNFIKGQELKLQGNFFVPFTDSKVFICCKIRN